MHNAILISADWVVEEGCTDPATAVDTVIPKYATETGLVLIQRARALVALFNLIIGDAVIDAQYCAHFVTDMPALHGYHANACFSAFTIFATMPQDG